jgi:hypothetical protein
MYSGERGQITCESGAVISPIVVGASDGNDKVVPVNSGPEYTTDTSTGPETVTTTEVVVNADSVDIVTTIRDRSQTEIDEIISRQFDSMDVVQNKALFLLFKWNWEMWGQLGNGTNAQQRLTALRNAIDSSPVDAQTVKDEVLR